MSHIALLPLDDRPCNGYFPQALAQQAGAQLLVPDKKHLGNTRKPASFEYLKSWARAEWASCQQLLLSLDTWVYGGLISSRKENQTLGFFQERLAWLTAFKAEHPHLKISAFMTLLRISDSHDATEEQPYWKDYGREIHRYSYLEDYLSQHAHPEYATELKALQGQVPPDIIAHYKNLRQRNFNLILDSLKLLKTGVFHHLYIGCDDGAEYGWNVQEKKQLETAIADQNLSENCLLYPGADELACTLLARALCPEDQSIQIRWSHPEAQTLTTRYEGIPLTQTLAHQAKAAGLRLDDHPNLPVLWIHNPPEAPQIDQFLDRDSRVSSLDFGSLQNMLKSDTPVALADVLYANGADIALLRSLEEAQVLPQLTAYGAWNTAGNTLGFVLAWFKIALKHPRTSDLFLLERLLDDGYYQGFLRQQLCGHYTDPVKLDSCLSGMMHLNQKLKDWGPQFGLDNLQVKHFSFPWKRFFEMDVHICESSCEPIPPP